MELNLGNFGSAVPINFKFASKIDGVMTTLGGSPAMVVYRDDVVTQKTGVVTLTVDFDGVIGLTHVHVDVSDLDFFARGRDYDIVYSAGTLGGVSLVGDVVAHFSIMNRRL